MKNNYAPQLTVRSSVATTHQNRMGREEIGRELDRLCELADRLAKDGSCLEQIIDDIAKWNREYQAVCGKAAEI